MSLKSNPVVKKVMEAGEAQVGRLASQLLSNERFMLAVQSMVSKTLAAKGNLDKSMRLALSTMNLPSSSDVEALRHKLDELERTVGELDAKVAKLDDKVSAAKKSKKTDTASA